jgi:hypothetical protein
MLQGKTIVVTGAASGTRSLRRGLAEWQSRISSRVGSSPSSGDPLSASAHAFAPIHHDKETT